MAILSAMLCIASIVEWVRSRHHVDVLAFRTPVGHIMGSASDHGGLLLAQSDLPYGGSDDTDGQEHAWLHTSLTPDEFSKIRDTILDTTAVRFNFLGFKTAGCVATMTSSPSPRFSALVLPYWFIALVMAAAPLGVGRKAWTRRRRRKLGLCLACGYDIRASSGRCPECGKEIPVAGESVA